MKLKQWMRWFCAEHGVNTWAVVTYHDRGTAISGLRRKPAIVQRKSANYFRITPYGAVFYCVYKKKATSNEDKTMPRPRKKWRYYDRSKDRN